MLFLGVNMRKVVLYIGISPLGVLVLAGHIADKNGGVTL